MEEKNEVPVENIQPDRRDEMIKARDEKIQRLSSHLSNLVKWAESYNTGSRCIMCGGQAGSHRTIGSVIGNKRTTSQCPIGEAKKSL